MFFLLLIVLWSPSSRSCFIEITLIFHMVIASSKQTFKKEPFILFLYQKYCCGDLAKGFYKTRKKTLRLP